MKRKVFLICAITAMLLAGCTPSNIVQPTGPVKPDFETKKGIVLDWGQIGDDLDKQFLNNEEYPMATSINYSVDQDKKNLQLTLMVHAGTTQEQAVTFATAVVKAVNDEAAIQDFSFANSTDQSYGGFFQEYSALVRVIPDGLMNDKSIWLVDMEIPAGSDKPIVAIEGSKVAKPTKAADETADEIPVESQA